MKRPNSQVWSFPRLIFHPFDPISKNMSRGEASSREAQLNNQTP